MAPGLWDRAGPEGAAEVSERVAVRLHGDPENGAVRFTRDGASVHALSCDLLNRRVRPMLDDRDRLIDESRD